MRVLSIASEAYPLIKTGGLADVVGALPSALAREGVEARTLLPGYPQVLSKLEHAELIIDAQKKLCVALGLPTADDPSGDA